MGKTIRIEREGAICPNCRKHTFKLIFYMDRFLCEECYKKLLNKNSR